MNVNSIVKVIRNNSFCVSHLKIFLNFSNEFLTHFFIFLLNALFSFLESDPFSQGNRGKMCFCLRTSNKYCADSCQLIGAPPVSHVIITAAAAFIIHLWRIAATNDAC